MSSKGTSYFEHTLVFHKQTILNKGIREKSRKQEFSPHCQKVRTERVCVGVHACVCMRAFVCVCSPLLPL